VQVLHEAAAYVQRELALHVASAFLSPSCDDYVRNKLGAEALSAALRLQMCRLAVAGDALVEVDAWEAAQPHFVDFPGVAQRLQDFLRRRLGQHVRVFYVCGSDHVIKCGLQRGIRLRGAADRAETRMPVVAIKRRGSELRGARDASLCSLVESDLDLDVSSTRVREALRTGAALDGLVHPDVAALLLQAKSGKGAAA
jgi:nicotinic acid mononucleotide adenylyltransferase